MAGARASGRAVHLLLRPIDRFAAGLGIALLVGRARLVEGHLRLHRLVAALSGLRRLLGGRGLGRGAAAASRDALTAARAGRDLAGALAAAASRSRVAADLPALADPQVFDWVVRVIVGFLAHPGASAEYEHELLARFVGPIVDRG